MQRLDNLNRCKINNADGPDVFISALSHRLRPATHQDITVYFSNLEFHLINEIRKWDSVAGCVAWLTNKNVLLAMAGRRAVSVIIQKEDWLRPDSGNYSKAGLHELYEMLPHSDRISWGCGDYNWGTATCHDMDGVRCCGIANIKRAPAAPRMHHKFMVFGNWVETADDDKEHWGFPYFDPQAVWTGSFNVTHNGTNSLENAVLIRSPEIARTYHEEYKAILGLSEPLDWEHEWVAPEYRIGS